MIFTDVFAMAIDISLWHNIMLNDDNESACLLALTLFHIEVEIPLWRPSRLGPQLPILQRPRRLSLRMRLLRDEDFKQY